MYVEHLRCIVVSTYAFHRWFMRYSRLLLTGIYRLFDNVCHMIEYELSEYKRKNKRWWKLLHNLTVTRAVNWIGSWFLLLFVKLIRLGDVLDGYS